MNGDDAKGDGRGVVTEPAGNSASGGASAESDAERLKRGSRALRGGLREAAVSAEPSFSSADAGILKFHGVYQQDNRDARVKRGEPAAKAWQMMVRLTIPGGALTADQYLALDGLADRYGNGTLRVTTRQSIQFHGVLKANLKSLLAELHAVQLTTLAACGDVSRNVMASPAPIDDALHRAVQATAREVAVALRPSTRAYFEAWLGGELVTAADEPVDPLYGEAYLPRKFKVGVATDTDTAIDLHNYDCGLLAVTERGRLTGFNVLAGGGFGMTHNKATTIARVASPVAFVAPADAVAAVRLVCEIFRDHGNRADRRHARLKYLIESWGVPHFIAELRARATFPVHDPVDVPTRPATPLLGRHPQGDGRWYYGAFVQSGRIRDAGDVRLRTALREIVRRFRPEVRLTPGQGVLLAHLSADDAEAVETLLAEHGVRPVDTLSEIVRHSMACPALPTCGLALAESERALPSILEELETEFAALGIDDTPLTVRMTGCPNGCARPYSADIAFVGRRAGVYHVYVGGGLAGTRLADLYAADVKVAALLPRLRPLLQRYAAERTEDEGLGDFYQRAIGAARPRHVLTGSEQPTELQVVGAAT